MANDKRTMICEAHDRCALRKGMKYGLTDHCKVHERNGACDMHCPIKAAEVNTICRKATDGELVYYKMVYPEAR